MGRALGDICHARRNGQEYSLDCPDCGAVVMQRSDFLLAFIEVPRGAREQPREYLGYRVRGLYPAPAEETAFDYRLLGAGRSAGAAVFVTRQQIIDGYRALEADLVLPLSLFQAAVPRLVAQGGLFLFVAPGWMEALALPGSKWKPEGRSLVVERTASLAGDLESAAQSPDAAELPVRILASRRETESLREALASGALAGRTVSLHAPAGRRGAGRAALFRAETARRGPAWSLRFQALLFLALALATLAYVRGASRERAYLAALEAQLQRLQSRVVGAASDRAQADALAREWAGLQARRPVDVYLLLSELSRLLGDGARVASLMVDGRLFQVEAEGRAALELVARLREDPSFEGVRLLQIVPAQNGLERFRLTGAFRAQ